MLFGKVQIRELAEQLNGLAVIRPRRLGLIVVQAQVEVLAFERDRRAPPITRPLEMPA